MEIKYYDLEKITQSFEPYLSESVQSVIKSGWFVLGNHVKAFERNFAEFCGTRHCVGVGNGLDALKVILMAYKQLYHWDNGDEVIVPAHTFIASAESIVQSQLKPVFCDVSKDDYLIDANQIDGLVTSKTRAIICVHLYGRLCKMQELQHISSKYNLKLIEDAAQAHGAVTSDNQRAGNLADAAAFSFYPTKNLGAIGDGGAIVTNDDDLAQATRQIANYGQIRKYYHQHQGVNSRLDELQAAVLNVKLKRLSEDNSKRMRIAKYYFENINNRYVNLPYHCCFAEDSVYHVFPVFSEQRDKLQQYLAAKGIETIIHYPVIPSKQRAFYPYNHFNFTVAEQVSSQELSIPLHPLLSQEEVEYISTTINQFVC